MMCQMDCLLFAQTTMTTAAWVLHNSGELTRQAIEMIPMAAADQKRK